MVRSSDARLIWRAHLSPHGRALNVGQFHQRVALDDGVDAIARRTRRRVHIASRQRRRGVFKTGRKANWSTNAKQISDTSH